MKFTLSFLFVVDQLALRGKQGLRVAGGCSQLGDALFAQKVWNPVSTPSASCSFCWCPLLVWWMTLFGTIRSVKGSWEKMPMHLHFPLKLTRVPLVSFPPSYTVAWGWLPRSQAVPSTLQASTVQQLGLGLSLSLPSRLNVQPTHPHCGSETSAASAFCHSFKKYRPEEGGYEGREIGQQPAPLSEGSSSLCGHPWSTLNVMTTRQVRTLGAACLYWEAKAE